MSLNTPAKSPARHLPAKPPQPETTPSTPITVTANFNPNGTPQWSFDHNPVSFFGPSKQITFNLNSTDRSYVFTQATFTGPGNWTYGPLNANQQSYPPQSEPPTGNPLTRFSISTFTDTSLVVNVDNYNPKNSSNKTISLVLTVSNGTNTSPSPDPQIVLEPRN